MEVNGRITVSLAVCPLCYRSEPFDAFGPLYDAPVCRRCRWGFVGRRHLAFVIDWIVWHLAMVVVAVVLVLVAAVLQPPRAVVESLFLTGVFIIAPVMLSMKDGFRGLSPGKAVCGLRVIHTATGRPAGLVASLQRNLVLCLPLMPLVLAFGLTGGHRIGDGWARTRVIRRKHARHPVFTGRPAAECTRCRYDLTGNSSGICSECGTWIVRPVVRPAYAA
jgi:uncharacterized RDD family membrane protein YckC